MIDSLTARSLRIALKEGDLTTRQLTAAYDSLPREEKAKFLSGLDRRPTVLSKGEFTVLRQVYRSRRKIKP